MDRSRDPFEFRRALPIELQRIHHEAALGSMALLGVAMDAWDTQTFINTMPEDPDPHDFGEIIFAEHDVIPLEVFGYPYARLTESGAPTWYTERFTEQSHAEFMAARINSPVKEINLGLYPTARSRARPAALATVYTSPDSPPCIFHIDDMLYIRRQHEPQAFMNVNILSEYSRLFGEDAVNYLTEVQCGLLIQAIRDIPSATDTVIDLTNLLDH